MPVVIRLSGVFGIASLTSRSRSHGSSRWKRTDTAMCVLEVKSSARNPTRSIVGAIASTSGVVSPVAPQRLWLPSRVVVSTISTRSLTTATRNSGAPSSTSSASSAQTSTIVPATPAGTEFIIFMISIMPTTVSGSTRAPTSTNGVHAGRVRAVERARHRRGDRRGGAVAVGWPGAAAAGAGSAASAGRGGRPAHHVQLEPARSRSAARRARTRRSAAGSRGRRRR